MKRHLTWDYTALARMLLVVVWLGLLTYVAWLAQSTSTFWPCCCVVIVWYKLLTGSWQSDGQTTTARPTQATPATIRTGTTSKIHSNFGLTSLWALTMVQIGACIRTFLSVWHTASTCLARTYICTSSGHSFSAAALKCLRPKSHLHSCRVYCSQFHALPLLLSLHSLRVRGLCGRMLLARCLSARCVSHSFVNVRNLSNFITLEFWGP